jgi:hypothetical protein
MARSFGVPVHAMGDRHVKALFEQADLLVDCVFGTGLSRAAEGEPLAAIERMNAARERGAFVFAVDVPSGMDADFGVAPGRMRACERDDLVDGIEGGLWSETASSAVRRVGVGDAHRHARGVAGQVWSGGDAAAGAQGGEEATAATVKKKAAAATVAKVTR